eukprot:gene1020-2004_t
MKIFYIFTFILLAFKGNSNASLVCDLYLAPSLVPGLGRGVIAGRLYGQGEQMLGTLSIFVPHELQNRTINYAWQSPDNRFSALAFGPWSLYNSRKVPQAGFTRIDGAFSTARSVAVTSHASSEPFRYFATTDISIGEEVFTDYGDEWFSFRVQVDDRPQFRHSISAPEGMYPEQWMIKSAEAVDSPDKELFQTVSETTNVVIDIEFDANTVVVTDDVVTSSITDISQVDLSIKETEHACDLYLAPSLVPGLGRGVIAGKPYGQSEPMIGTMSIFISDLVQNRTRYYTWQSPDVRFSSLAIGPWSLYNSRNDPQAGFTRIDGAFSTARSAAVAGHASSEPFRYFATTDISIGEEVFTDYGDEWFSFRGIVYNESLMANVPRYSLEELKSVGHCMTDVIVSESIIPGAGKGLFSRVSFKTGEVVSVSPVLMVPRGEAEAASADSVVLNFCITSGESDVALLPLSFGAMSNHGGREANMRLAWYDWGDSEGLSQKLSRSMQELMESPYATLDIGYIATRDIAVGEELTIDYGSEWESEWSLYQERLSLWETYRSRSRRSSVQVDDRPQFRHSISAPEGMYPEQWIMLDP